MSIWLPRYWKRQNRVFSQLSILTLMNAPLGAFIENYFSKCARNENVSLVSRKAKYLHYIARTASLKLLYFNWDKFLNIWFTYKPLFTWGQCEWSCPSPCEKDTFKFFLLYPPVNSWKTDSNQLRCFGCSNIWKIFVICEIMTRPTALPFELIAIDIWIVEFTGTIRKTHVLLHDWKTLINEQYSSHSSARVYWGLEIRK